MNLEQGPRGVPDAEPEPLSFEPAPKETREVPLAQIGRGSRVIYEGFIRIVTGKTYAGTADIINFEGGGGMPVERDDTVEVPA
jgi:hypothetical protein